MNRRDVLKLGLAGVGVALSADAEAAPGEDVPGAVARLRRRLDHTRELDLGFLGVPKHAPPAARERAEIDAQLIRSSMRALLVTGAVMDLGEDAQAHPDVQKLVEEMSPELDHAVEGSLLRLQTLPRADRRRVRAELKRNPAIVEDVSRELEHLAGKGGASAQRRLHLRSLLKQVNWRLTHQPFDTVLADAVDQTRAQEALLPADAPGPTREGPWAEATERLWRAFGPARDTEALQDGPRPSPRELPDWDEGRADRLRRRAATQAYIGLGLLAGGAILLGLGLLTSGSGGFALVIASLFVFTAVIVMLIIALVTAIMAASAASNAASQGDYDSEDGEAARDPPSKATAEPDTRVEVTLDMIGLTRDGVWFAAGIRLAVASTYRLRAVASSPEERSPAGNPAQPAGVDAPAPSLPLGAVLGRVGELVFVIGDEYELGGVWGDLELAVNAPPAPAGAGEADYAANFVVKIVVLQ